MVNIFYPLIVISMVSSVLSVLVQINYVVEERKTLIPKTILYINIFASLICGILGTCMAGHLAKQTDIKAGRIKNNEDTYYEARVEDYYLTKNSSGIPYAWYQTDKGLFLFRYAEPTKNTKVIVLKVYNNNTPNDTNDDTVMELNFYEYYYEVK